MSGKIAFCFPGQGSLSSGMGREFAESVPEAMEVYRRGSEAAGLDLVRLCFEAPESELVVTEVQQPALVATSAGCCTSVSTSSSSGASKHSRSRSSPQASLPARRTSIASGLSRISRAMPGAAEPWPGKQNAILWPFPLTLRSFLAAPSSASNSIPR